MSLAELFYARHPRRLSSPRSRKRGTRARRRKILFEPLEPRLLLNAQPLALVAATAADLSIHIIDDHGTPTVQVVDDKAPDPANNVLASQALADTSRVQIQGSDQNDKLTIDASVVAAGLPIDFVGGVGSDTLVGPPVDSTWHIIGANAGTVGNVTFSGVENLTGAPDNHDAFVFEASGSVAGVVDGGAGGFDTINLAGGYFQSVRYTVSGPASGTIARDGDVITYTGFEPITDLTVGPTRSFSGTTSADHINLLDRGTPTDDSFAISMDTGEDVIFIDASAIKDLSIDAGAGDDRIVIDPIDAGFNGNLTINAGADNDDITLTAKTGHGLYTLDGGGDTGDTLRITSGGDMTLSDTSFIGVHLAATDVNVTQRPHVQTETTIAVDPTDHNHIIIGANDNPGGGAAAPDNVWVTVNGGTSWTLEQIPLPSGATGSSGDPSVVFDRTGRAIYAHLLDDGSLAGAVKPKKGDPWTPVVIVQATATIHTDKAYLAVGPRPGDLTKDRIVATYVDTTNNTNDIFALASDDGGLTWNALGGTTSAPTPMRVSSSGSGTDPIPAIGPNGELYVVWEDFATTGKTIVKFRASVDGGTTWGTERDIYTGNVNLFHDPVGSGSLTGSYAIPAQPLRGVGMALSMDVDRSGAHNGRIYVGFNDQADLNGQVDTGTAAHDDLDVFVTGSDDGGATWTAVGSIAAGTTKLARINDDGPTGKASQFHAWLDVDQSNGNVAISWQDARNDTAGAPNKPNDQVDYFAAISIDGGQTWSANVRVSDGLSLGPQDSFDFQEYTNDAFVDGTIYMAWPDRSNSTGDNPGFTGATPDFSLDVYYDRASVDALTLSGFERAIVNGTSLKSDGFSGQVFFNSNLPQWVEQGPTPFSAGLGTAGNTFPDEAGAIQAVVVDPNDRFTTYIGTTNGGVWRNTGSEEVLFALNSADLTLDAKTTLNVFAAYLELHPNLTVEIGGHTDASGSETLNNTLSLQRANAVRDYLVNTRLVDPARLTVKAYGETRPIDKNDAQGHSDKNRRVELLVNNWEPLTDAFPSLSISALALSPLSDPGSPVIFAGLGRTSSSINMGGAENGLLFSNDGGNTWRVLGQNEFAGLRITQVLPTTLTGPGGQVVFVSTMDVDRDGNNVLDDKGGVFRGEIAADGTGTFVKISNVGTSGLPKGHITDLAMDPGVVGDSTRPVRLYAASPSDGIFQFTDGTDDTWHAVNTGFEFGTDLDSDGHDDLLEQAKSIRLAIDKASGTLYAAVIGPVNDHGLASLGKKDFGLSAVFKTTNFAAGWIALPAPTSNDGADTFGLNVGDGDFPMLSIAVDPTNANIVYVAGNHQPVAQANSAGLVASDARIFRFMPNANDPNTGNWEQIVGNNANGTAPHADSRAIAFGGDYELIETDDGGIYRLQNPRAEANQGTRQWSSLNRDLRATEIRTIGFDPLNGVILAGTQDNGSVYQRGTVDHVDNNNNGLIDEANERFFWQRALTGDGSMQAAIPFVENGQNRVLVYSMGNGFARLVAREFDNAGNQIGNPITVSLRSGPGAAPLSGLNPEDAAKADHGRIPMVVNSIDPTRMLLALQGLYESIHTNLTPANPAQRVVPLEQMQLIQPMTGVKVDFDDRISALVYGGTSGGVANPDLIIAARKDKLLIRTARVTDAGGNIVSSPADFTERTVPGAARILDIAVDPTNWKKVFVVDNNGDVFRIADVTDNNQAWVKITGNLPSLGQLPLTGSQSAGRPLEYIRDGANDILLVSGHGGVSRLFNPGAADNSAIWTNFGAGLPNALVFDTQFVDRDNTRTLTGRDVLVVGTLGRGAWTMSGSDLRELAQPTVLRIIASAAGTNKFEIKMNAANPLMFDVFDVSSGTPELVLSAPFRLYSEVDVVGRGGNNTLTVSSALGAVAVPNGIHFDGGPGTGNSLVLQGTASVRNVKADSEEIFDQNGQRQIVFHQNATRDDSNVSKPLDNAFITTSGSLLKLADALTLDQGLARDVPVFGESFGRALNGIVAEGGPGEETSDPDSAPIGGGSDAALVTQLLRRFIETGTGAFSIADIAGFTTLDQLRTALQGLDESGTGTVSPPTGDVTTGFELTLTGIKKTLSGQADVDLNLLNGAVHMTGLVDVSADVTLNLTLGVDNTHGFYIKSTAAHEIVIDNVKVQADTEDGLSAVGKFGFLGVDMSAATLTMDPQVHFDVDVADAGGDAFVEVPELLGNLANDVTVNLVGHPGDATKDVTLTGTFAVSALLPGGIAPLALGSLDAKFEWEDIGAADLNGGGNLTIGPANTAAQTLLKFLKVDAPNVLHEVTDLAKQLSSSLNVKVPFLGALSDALKVLDFIDTKIVDPLTGGDGITPRFPTIQSLIVQVAHSLGIDPSALGLSFNNDLLTFHLMLDKNLVNETVPLGGGVDLARGLADLQFSTNASIDADVKLDVVVGVDLGAADAGKPADQWFFVKDPTATATLALAANNVAASARFGFLSIDVFDGSVTANAALSISLNDPGSDAADGRIDIAELGFGLTHLDQLVSAHITGSANLELPIKAPFLGLNGTTPTPDNTLVVDIPDFTDFKTAIIHVPAALQDVANFANIDAASFVGLLGQLTGWLDQFRKSNTFAGFDIPFVGPALDKVLALNAAFRNAVLIDEGSEDQIDGSDTLAADINQALQDAGLDGKLHAEITGDGKVRLIANDFSGTSFTLTSVEHGDELGFDPSQTATALTTSGPLAITATNTPSGATLGDTVKFTISFAGGSPVTVTLNSASTTDNTRLGDDRWKLVNATNGATFSTVDEMAVRLAQVLGIGNALAYDTAQKTLAFTLNLTPTFGSIDLPVKFDLDLKPLLQLQSNSLLHLVADGSLHLTVGVYLGDAPSSSKLDTSKSLSQINGGVKNKTDLVITGSGDVRTVYGQLSGDASFDLSLNGGPAKTVTISKAATLGNTSVADLVADINVALTTAALSGQVQAAADGNRIVLSATTPMHLSASNANPTVAEIGFAASQDAVNDNGTYKLTTTKDLPTLYGRLTGDATFNVTLNGDAPVAVSLPKANTDTNRFSFDIVNDVQSAINGTSLNGKVTVGFTNVDLGDGKQHGRLTLTAAGATGFSLTASGAAASDLGLGTSNTGNSNEFTITTRNGNTFGINLDNVATLGDLLSGPNSISAQTTGAVSAALNERQTGINLTDGTTGTGTFQVRTVNNSSAAATLGILGVDAQQGQTPDGVIEGTDIAGLRPADRFFLQNVGASVGLHLRTPDPTDQDGDGDLNDGLRASAHVGFLGVNLKGAALVDAVASLTLKDPGTTAADGKISLTELFNGLSDINTLLDAPTLGGTEKIRSTHDLPTADGHLTGDAAFTLSVNGGSAKTVTIAKAATLDNASAADLAADINAALTTASLDKQIQALGDGQRIVLMGLGGVTAMHLSASNANPAVTELGFDASQDAVNDSGDIKLFVSVTPALPGLTVNSAHPIVVHIASLGNPFSDPATGPDISVTIPDDLVAFSKPDFSFDNILAGLKALTDFLGQFQSFGFLNDPIPVINVSFKDLLNLADKFATAIDQASADPAGTVQALQDKLKEAFGIPKASNLLTLALFVDPHGDGTADDQYFLRITTDLNTDFDKSLNVSMDLGSGLALGGSAGLQASGSLDVKLDFGIDLHDPTNIDIFGGTGITAALTASGNALNFKAAIGPAGIFIKNGTATLDAGVLGGIDGLTGDEHVALSSLFSNDALGGVHLDITDASHAGKANIHASLPVYFPTESRLAGTIGFDWNDLTVLDSGNVDGPHLDVPANLLSIDPSQFSLLDQLSLGVDGIDRFLAGLQDLMDGAIGGVKLPLIGDKLAGAANVIGDFRTDFIDPFRQAIDDFANPADAFAEGGTDPISKILFHLLGPKNQGGLGFLQDSNNDHVVTPADIVFAGNVSDPGVALQNIFANWHFKLGGTLVSANPGIGFDIGIPGLSLETRGKLSLNINWSLQLGFGLDYTNGFFIDISPHDELRLDVDVSVPQGGITGTLGFLQLTANDHQGATHLGATFGIDIANGKKAGDDKLSFNELGDLDIIPVIGASAVVDLDARLSLSSALVPNAATNFPSVIAEFVLDWSVGNRAAGVLVPLTQLGGNFLEDGLQFVGFKNVGLDLGSYFTDFIEPIAKKVQEYTAPIKPFLDFLTTPIPVISDLAGPTTLLDLAAASGAINPGLIKALEFVDKIVDIANELVIPSTGNIILKFGNGEFPIFDASAGLTLDLADPSSVGAALTSGTIKLPSWADLGGLDNALNGVAPEVKGAIDKLAAAAGAAPQTKFSVPLIEDPSQVFGMLLGKHAVLLDLDLAPLEVKADFSAFFPLLGPLGVSINAEFDMKAHFDFGYDTLGAEEFAKGGFKNPLLLFDGFFVNDFDKAGKDVPEVILDAGLWAAAELNLGVARGGVGGGLFAHITLDLHDPNKDGRVRIAELVTDILNEAKYGNPVLAPLAVFDDAGSLTARLFAFLKIDLFLFSIDEKWDITKPIELLKFNDTFVRVPTLATELDGGALQLNMGPNAAQRVEGDLTDGDETFFVKQGHDASHVLVWAPDLGVSEANAQEYLLTSTLIADGGKGNDVIDASQVTANVNFDLRGDAGDDLIKAGSGTGAVTLFGGGGDDTLWGGGGNDTIFGEAGADEIHGGGGHDLIFGDGDSKTSIQAGVLVAELKASDGADTIYGDDGDDTIFGSGGVDSIHGGKDNDTIFGDGAKVTLDDNGHVVKVEQTDKGKGGNDLLFGDEGNDLVYGGPGNDTIDGGDDNDTIFGESGFDTLTGAGGADVIHGGADDDSINGGIGNDTLYGDAGNDTMSGDDNDDWLYGGDGSDTMHGGAGADHLLGNGAGDFLYGDAGNDYLEGGGGDDIARGDTGNDTLVGGFGSDNLDGEQDGDVYLISSRGGDIDQLTTVFDSGGGDPHTSGTDTLTITGTPGDDTFLLRAMADYYYDTYYPTKSKVIDAITTVFNDATIAADKKLDALKAAVTTTYTFNQMFDVPEGMLNALSTAYGKSTPPQLSDLTAAIDATYIESGLALLYSLVNPIVGSALSDAAKLNQIEQVITDAYSPDAVPAGMFDAIKDASLSDPASVRSAIASTFAALEHDTGFVALLNNGGAHVERFNYRDIEGLTLNTIQGNDDVVLDDVIAATTINLGLGDDTTQIGQVFNSQRVGNFDTLITNINPPDAFATLAITRGWLSNGVSVATTINGGEGNDEFTVFHNVAVLNLNGGDGDDLFTIRAFALAGSIDSQRGRTDIKGDGGADTILYVSNAPVNIDGGDGFDTVRVVGTEFADDFVVTDAGVFGAGLNVNYVNIEKLIADGAEGNDRFFVLSTGIDVVTEVDGGLGSDTFFVGGTPQHGPIPVVSNDFRGYSSIILNGVESTDPTYSGISADGLSVNVVDDEESNIIVSESGGFSRVTEGATSGGEGWQYDSYTVRLSRAPAAGLNAAITVIASDLAPDAQARGFKDLEFLLPGHSGNAASDWVPYKQLPALVFTATGATAWNIPQTVKFRAVDDGAPEGTRDAFINHTTSTSTDPGYRAAKLLSVKVQINDNDNAGVLITPTDANGAFDRGNTVLEGGFTDTFQAVLTRQPTADVTVHLSTQNNTVTLSTTMLTFSANPLAANAWNKPQTVAITAVDDAVVQGFHTDDISYTVSSDDHDIDVPVAQYLVNGDFDLGDAQTHPLEIPIDKPTSFVFLRDKPDLSQPVTVLYDAADNTDANGVPESAGVPVPVFDPNDVSQQTDDVLRYAISGSTLSFYKNGFPVALSGAVQISYSYLKAGYNNVAVKDSVVDIYDNDAASVIVTQSNGSTDVIEHSGNTDTYSVVLSKAPAAGTTVTIDVTPIDTRSTIASTGVANFAKHVLVHGPNSNTFVPATTLTFDANTWNIPQTVTVTDLNDGIVDGDDTQVFAPELQTTHKIRGPLILEGASGAGSLSLPPVLMLPNERNVRASDGQVVSFTPGAGTAPEFMTVKKSDLMGALPRFAGADPPITSINDLVGKTLELTEGPGTGIVLDASRPRDLFNRFWQINAIQDIGGGLLTLTLQNPSAVDPSLPNVTKPTSATKYAITALSVNFFADERQSIDYTMVFDTDSVANENGALTSSTGNVLAFAANVSPNSDAMTVRTSDLQAIAALNNDLTKLVNKQLEITIGLGLARVWTISNIVDGTVAGTKVLTLTRVSGNASDLPADRSEYRIAGGDTRGRITGFGMGPNVRIGDAVQSGAITYGDMEVVQMDLGKGADVVRVDYTTNAEDHTTKRSGDFYTLTMLNTGDGNDTVTAKLLSGQDGDFALNLGAGNDTADASASTLPLTIFGWTGNDTITGGSGNDTIFGDVGRVDYLNDRGRIVTRLGQTPALNPVNPTGTSATATTLTDTATTFYGGHAFPTDDGGLVGLVVQAISPKGLVQFRTIAANTSDTLTIDHAWDTIPVFNDPDPKKNWSYRIATLPEDQTDGIFRGPTVAWSIFNDQGGNDSITAGGGADTIVGGVGADTVSAGAGNDWVAGDDARFDYQPINQQTHDGPTQLTGVQTTGPTFGGNDTIDAGTEQDVVIGGTGADTLDGGADADLIFGDNVQLVRSAGSGNAITPRFRALTGTLIYGANGQPQIGGPQAVPGGQPVWADWTITLDQTLDPTHFDNDYIAGGAGNDEIFGQLGNDTIQGDGSIQSKSTPVDLAPAPSSSVLHRLQTLNGGAVASSKSFNGATAVNGATDTITLASHGFGGGETVVYRNNGVANVGGLVNLGLYKVVVVDANTIRLLAPVDASRRVTTDSINTAGDQLTGLLLVTPSFDAASDGDDYIEGNGGSDVIFGNQGQDDLVGGSSSLFSLSTPALRPDGADLIFGGSGTMIARNDAGDGSAQGHAKDADAIVGDNGNIYRLVGTNGVGTGQYLTFNYDNYTAGLPPAQQLRIIPRAIALLDYTPGGPDFTPAAEPSPVDVAINPTTLVRDIGAADEIHGEAGDDFIHGQVGGDVLFGDAQNDVIIGGYGADWISGGSGDDGILGDDGRMLVSRNSSSFGEPLYGVAAIPAANLNQLISTPDGVNNGVINVTNALKYTADLTPDNLDPSATPNVLFRPLYANDIIYGGLGNDAIHGGAGDDAISGAEAPVLAYTNNYTTAGALIAGQAHVESDFAHPFNPGNPLGYQTGGANATKFDLYDANDALRKIMLTATGTLAKTGGDNWILNFDQTEGPIDTFWIQGQSTYAGVPTDGDDHIFGDLGNDWTVGGTGRDVLYSGWGDDLLNADDNLNTAGTTKNGVFTPNPDTNPSYEDVAFGGAGRDVLIGNTNGDRLMDWVGEFNTYLVPFAQFGAVSVSRLLRPSEPQYLYDLSKSDGADPTLAAQYGSDPARNGEPFGELGLVLQGDAAYQDQTAGPRDPQAGNVVGGKVDIGNNPGTAGTKPIYETAEGGAAMDGGSAPVLTDAQLAPIVAEAKALWTQALGAGDSRLAALDTVQVGVGSLPDGRLGVTIGQQIYIDYNAAGYGWFTDGSLGAGVDAGRMDLLTVVAHELGNAMGFPEDTHASGAVTTPFLPLGARYLPDGTIVQSSGTADITGAAVAPQAPAERERGFRFDVGPANSDTESRAVVDWDRELNDVLAADSVPAWQRRRLEPRFPDFAYTSISRTSRAGELVGDALENLVLAPVGATDWHIEVEPAIKQKV